MFRGKETGNKITRRISAAILALVLVLTSFNVDWNVLRASAGWGVYESVSSGTIIACKHTVQGTSTIKSASVKVTGVAGDEITATLVGIYKNITYSPKDGTSIPISSGSAITASHTTTPIDLTIEGGAQTLMFDLSSLDIVLAPTENISVLIKVESNNGNQIKVNSNSEDADGFISQNVNDESQWLVFNKMIEVIYDSTSADNLESVDIIHNIPKVNSAPVINLSKGQTFQISAEVPPGYYRYIDYTMPDPTQTVYTFDRPGVIVAGNDEGTAQLKIGGDGVNDILVTVNVIGMSASPEAYTYTGSSISPTLVPSMGTATAPAATDFMVRNPAINAGHYSVEVAGKSDKYPGYVTTVNYTIEPIDISNTTNSAKLSLDPTKFYVDPSTGQVKDGSKITYDGKDYDYGNDFSATAVFNKAATDLDTSGRYVYDVTITGKGNFINSATKSLLETINTSALKLKDVYTVTLNQSEIIWDGTTTPIANPTLTFTNKLSGATYSTKPGDVSVNYDTTASNGVATIGPATATVTSTVYNVTPVQGDLSSGPIVLDYLVKQKIDSSTVDIVLEKPSYVEEMVNGSYVKKEPSVKVLLKKDGTEIDSTNYTVRYSNNEQAGVATVTVIGNANSYYSGSASTTFSILPDISRDAWISIGGVQNPQNPNPADYAKASNNFLSAYSATYTGNVIQIQDSQIEILVDGVVLDHKYYHVDRSGDGVNSAGIVDGKAGVDVGIGNGSVLIKTTPEYGEQTIRVYFTITPCELKDVSIVPLNSEKYSTARTYTGKEIKLHETQEYTENAFEFRVVGNNGKVVDESQYTLEYENNINAGMATLIAKGVAGGNYTGSVKVNFEIKPYNISGEKFTIDPIGNQSFIGAGVPVSPKPIMYFDGDPVTDTTRFTFDYKDNESISTPAKRALVTINGGGNFEGSRNLYYDIVSKSITNSSVTFSVGGANPVTAESGKIDSTLKLLYNGGRQIPDLVIRDNGVKLEQGKDYNIRPANNINIKGGTDTNPPSLTVIGIGNYGNSSGNTVLITFTIEPRDINITGVSVTIDPDTHQLTKVEDEGNKERKVLIEGTDYEVKITGRDNDVEWDGTTGGDYTMTITGIGNYIGTKTQYFTHGTNVKDLTVTLINPILSTSNTATLTTTGTQYFQYIGGNRPFVKIEKGSTVVDSGISYEFLNPDGTPAVDFFTDGDFILRLTGSGEGYFGTYDFKYNENVAVFSDTLPNTSSVGYKNDFSITVNGVTKNSENLTTPSSNYYILEFPYMENTILKDEEIPVSVVFRPVNRCGVDGFTQKTLKSSTVDVTITGTLDLTKETTGDTTRELVITATEGSGFSGSKTIKYKVKKPSINGAAVTGIEEEYTFKNAAYTPSDFPNIVVTLEGKNLVKDRDYTVEVEALTSSSGSTTNVTKNGSDIVNGAQVVIKGKGEYDSATQKAVQFKIVPKNIADSDVIIEAPTVVGLDASSSAKKPEPKITFNAKSLVVTTDFTLSGNDISTVGEKTMLITGTGNYTGTVSKKYVVKDNLSAATVSGIDTIYQIDEQGKIIGKTNGKILSSTSQGGVEVTYGTDGLGNPNHLAFGVDYIVKLTPDSFAPGNGRTVTIEGINNYTGTVIKSNIKVVGKFTDVSGVESRIVYTGNPVSGPVVKFRGDELILNTDYTVKYEVSTDGGTTWSNVTGDVTQVGKYKVTVTGILNYDGSTVSKVFDIVPKGMGTVTLEVRPEWEYTGALIDVSSTVRVKDGDTPLTKGVHYTINDEATSLKKTDPGVYTVTITGMGNYENETKNTTFTIVADINKYNFTKAADAILVTGSGEKAVNNVNVSAATYNEVGDINAFVTYAPAAVNPLYPPEYTVSYEGNLIPGSRGSIVVEGKAPYFKGKKTLFTNILVYGLIEGVRWMNAPTETDNGKPVFGYTGSVINPLTTAELELNGQRLTTSNYASGTIAPTSTPAPATNGQDIGDYRVTLKGAGYYLGSKNIDYCIRYDLANATVTVDPTTFSYDGTEKEPKITVRVRDKEFNNKDGATEFSANFTLNYENNVAAGTASATVSGLTGKSVGTATRTFRINRADKTNGMSLALVGGAGSASNEYEYTGEAINPEITVEVDNNPLTPDTNPAHSYTITYPNYPVGVGTYKAIVELTGSYSGKKEITYRIVPRSIAGSSISVEDVYYTGKKAKPIVSVTDSNGTTLTEGRDYTVSIPDTAIQVQENVVVTIRGINNYTGTQDGISGNGTFNILPIDISQPGVITVRGTSKVYDGVTVTDLKSLPGFSVSMISADGSSVELSQGDYEASFIGPNPVNANPVNDPYQFTISASAANKNITGVYTGTYAISKKPLSNDMLVYSQSSTATTGYRSSIGYNTTADTSGNRFVNRNILVNPDFTVSADNNVEINPQYYDLYDIGIGKELYKVNSPDTPEVEVKYSGNDMAGIATFTFVANESGNYSGEVSFKFKIGKDISDSEAGVTINPTTYEYDGEAKMPEVTSFTYGGSTLTPGTDYTVDWEDNPVNVGTHYVYVRGNGKNYYGEIKKPYTITKRPKTYLYADFAEGALVDGYKWIYNGSPATPSIVVYDSGIDGKVLDPSEYTVTYRNNTSVGTAYYMVSINNNSNYDSGAMTNYAGGSNAFQIEASELDSSEIEIRLGGVNPYTFTGREIKPIVAVYHNGTQVSSSNYTVEYTNNKLPGQAQVTVILKGNYEGYASKTFDIVANLGSTQTVSVNAADRRWTGQAVDGSGVTAYLISNPVKKLTEGVDYDIEITPVGGDWSTAVRAKAVLTGITSEYKGTRTVYFNLTKDLTPGKDPDDPGYVEPKPDPLPDDDNPGGGGTTPGTRRDLNSTGITATITAPAGGFAYNGSAFTPSVTVMDGTKTLTRGNSQSTTADYYVTYRNNINAGTAYADIIGINAYSGTLTRSFLIANGTGGGTSGTTITIPGFSATAQGTNAARLTWGSVTGANSYLLSWRGSNGTTGSQAVSAGSTSATVYNLTPGVTYTFTLTAYGTGNSTGSAQAVCTTQASGSTGGGTINVTPVSGLTGVSATTGTATLSWENPQDGTYYEVYRSTTPSSYGSYIGSVVNGGTVRCVYADRNSLVSGRTYYYWVRPYRYVNNTKVLGSYSSNYIAITIK